MKSKNLDLRNDPEKCDCQIHMLKLISANSRNKMDEIYTSEYAEFECMACGKIHTWFTKQGAGWGYYEKDGVVIESYPNGGA